MGVRDRVSATGVQTGPIALNFLGGFNDRALGQSPTSVADENDRCVLIRCEGVPRRLRRGERGSESDPADTLSKSRNSADTTADYVRYGF